MYVKKSTESRPRHGNALVESKNPTVARQSSRLFSGQDIDRPTGRRSGIAELAPAQPRE